MGRSSSTWKLKIFFWKKSCYQEENTKKKQRRLEKISFAAWSGIVNSESILLRSWLTEKVTTYLRSSSSSYYFEFKKAEPRSWNCAKYTREYEYSWKRFWLSTCSTRSSLITQWFKKFGDIISDSEKRRNWEQCERRTIAINTFTLLFSESKERKV